MKNYIVNILIFCLSIISTIAAQNSTIYSGKDATLFNAFLETKNSGYASSEGYINFENQTGGYVEWKVFMAVADTQTITIQYANGTETNRKMDISVNDTANKQIDFFGRGAWTNWTQTTVQFYLKEGLNLIRFTGLLPDGGPNIDFIIVSGEKGIIKHQIVIDVLGGGKVSINPDNIFYDDSSKVTLTAIADNDWLFDGWSGDLISSENPVDLVVNNDKKIYAKFFIPLDTVINDWDEYPIGFASIDTLGENGTTGGIGGDTLTVNSGLQLYNILEDRRDEKFEKNHNPLVIIIDGTITWGSEDMMDVKGNYDLTIIGKGEDAIIEDFGLNIYKSYNIIIRNLEFRNCHDDAISIANEITHHIWIDHCTFSDDPESGLTDDNHDGLLDIKDGTNFITVSWNHFYNHRKTSLVGHSDNNGETDIGKLKVTYHHNWFDNTNQRHPRVRFGTCHIFNNYYDNSKNIMTYGIASTMEADVVVESNYFFNLSDPTHVGQAASGPGDLVEFNNIYDNSGLPEIRGESFIPSHYYFYNPDDTFIIPELVKKYSGHGKLNIITSVKNNQQISRSLNLSQNYPNPFNPVTIIRYSLPELMEVKLSIYNLLGEEIIELINKQMSAGKHSIRFDTSLLNLSSGVYIYSLKSKAGVISKKLMFVK